MKFLFECLVNVSHKWEATKDLVQINMALFIVVVVINKFVLLLLFFLKFFVVLSPFFAFFAISIIYTVTHDDYDIMCSPLANRISYIITFYSCIILLKADE